MTSVRVRFISVGQPSDSPVSDVLRPSHPFHQSGSRLDLVIRNLIGQPMDLVNQKRLLVAKVFVCLLARGEQSRQELEQLRLCAIGAIGRNQSQLGQFGAIGGKRNRWQLQFGGELIRAASASWRMERLGASELIRANELITLLR